MDYLELGICLPPDQESLAIDRLILAGWTAIALGEERYGPDQRPSASFRTSLMVYVPFAQGSAPERELAELLVDLDCTISSRLIHEEDWAESWKQYWHVQHIGTRLVVRPSWEPYHPKAGELVVVIDPKQAFGTGTHPTTRLCLQALEDLVCPGDRVYDIGSGSGILAIAAIRLGAREAVGIDTDSIATLAALENAQLNLLANCCSFRTGDVSQLEQPADLVVANILASVIVGLAPQLAKVAARDLIVSGIAANQQDQTRSALELQGLELYSQQTDGDWVAQVFRLPPGQSGIAGAMK